MATRTSYETTETLNGNQKWADRWIREHSFSHIYIKGAAGLRLVVVVMVLTKMQTDGPADRQSQTDSQSNSDGKLARVEMQYKWHICAPQHSGGISKHGNNWSQIFYTILSIERSKSSQYQNRARFYFGRVSSPLVIQYTYKSSALPSRVIMHWNQADRLTDIYHSTYNDANVFVPQIPEVLGTSLGLLQM